MHINTTLKKYFKKYFSKLFKRAPKISLLRLEGVIGQVSYRSGLKFDLLKPLIDQAFKDEKQKAVALIINSPGGAPVQAALIARYIEQKARETKIPVISFVEDVAASGGYWLAAAASKIYANESSIIGSIGVISAGFGFDKLIKKWGIERRIYTSGKSKSMLDPFKPAKAEDIKKLEAIQTEVHEHFINYVKSKRAKKIKTQKNLFTGDIFSGIAAQKNGLIDGLNDPYSYFKAKYGKKVKFIPITQNSSFIKKILNITAINNNRTMIDDRMLNHLEEKLLRNEYGL